MCNVSDNVSVLGTIAVPGNTDVFHFSVPGPGLDVSATLMDLPADYDLYVGDSAGTILGQSVQEGTAAEHVGLSLDGGTYYLYVNADPGRTVDPDNRYRLEMRFANALANAAPAEQELVQAGPAN